MRLPAASLAVAASIALAAIAGCSSPAVSGWVTSSDPQDAGRSAEGGTASGDDAATGSEDAAGDAGREAAAPVDDAGGMPPPAACTYPAGPYGVDQGSTLAPTLSWQGYAAGSSAVSTLHASDLFDCDGTKGINAIVLDESATYCPACQAEAQDLEAQMMSTWRSEGVAFVTLMAADANENPATLQTALDWRTTYGLQEVGVYADPAFLLYSPMITGIPANYLVDPRTMKILTVSEGYTGPDPDVDQLAKKNMP
jgi:hypothetical protein